MTNFKNITDVAPAGPKRGRKNIWDGIVDDARNNFPGKWAQVDRPYTPKSANSSASRLRKLYRNLDVRAVKIDDRRAELWIMAKPIKALEAKPKTPKRGKGGKFIKAS